MPSPLTPPDMSRNFWRETPRAIHVAIENFTPQVFIICMGTGILSVLLRNNSYQFRGLDTIAVVGFIIDLTLFVFFTALFLARWAFYTHSMRVFRKEAEDTTYLSTAAIAMVTLIQLITLICGSNWRNWQYVSYGIWWFTVVFAVSASTLTYMLLMRDEETHLSNVSPTLLLPTTALISTGSAGSLLVSETPLPVTLAQPVLIVSYMLLGAGFFVGLMTITAFFTRLISHSVLPAQKAASQMLPVAVLSNAVYTFSKLGYVAGPSKQILEDYGNSPITDPNIVNGLYSTGFVFSITIFGFASYWLILSSISTVIDARKAPFNMSLWSITYPLGVYGVACTSLATDLDATAFRVLASIVLVALVIIWLYLVAYTIPLFVTGEVFLKAVREEQLREKEEKEERGLSPVENGANGHSPAEEMGARNRNSASTAV